MRTMSIKNNMKFSGREAMAAKQNQRMIIYQKNMERTLNRKKTNHHMIRKG